LIRSPALSAGGQDNGGPGLRAGRYPSGYYAAFVLDPDGNNIEAVFRGGQARPAMSRSPLFAYPNAYLPTISTWAAIV
jgi:hypothetical protein